MKASFMQKKNYNNTGGIAQFSDSVEGCPSTLFYNARKPGVCPRIEDAVSFISCSVSRG